ncbi:MAG: hypothetical protein LUQ65_05020 [Candidatus Helarchaeota archaeon]|nr:hypothetical protein [Candidatus Helarchaeota archaeon]
MFILCLLGLKKTEIQNITLIKDKILEYIKNEIDDLRQIDNVVETLLKPDEMDLERDLGMHLVKDFETIEKLDIKIGETILNIPKETVSELKSGFRVLYVTERTVFVPILVAPKWVKGLVKEKNIEMQILSPGFTLADQKFHLLVVEYGSDRAGILKTIASGVLLILYLPVSTIV